MESSFLPKIGLSALLFVGSAFAAQAQTKISAGPRLGGNLSTFNTTGSNTGTASNIFSGQFGAAMDISFGGFSFQPALLYTQKGSELNFTSTQNSSSGGSGYSYTYSETVTIKATPRINYFEIPLNLVYTAEGSGFQVFAGPYLAFGLGGTFEYDYKDVSTDTQTYGGTTYTSNHNEAQAGKVDVTFDDKYPNPNLLSAPPTSIPFRKFDMGLNGGVGFRRGPVQVQAGYSMGFNNLIPNDSDGKDVGITAKNRSIQLAATYLFELSK
ncbi:outer membrane beta-barrel protein [Hymenobacter rubidus]|uniref:outer membrane beta-barrel protein n=1 Tax=Hymenobacter rubidus TaxID=1441626 RepID=UPI00191D3CBC|nr:outer membrane beta-barrel protein [Hymenobacter rubidus]